MAIKPCKECGAKVSTKAKQCPGCGVPNPTTPASSGCAAAIVLIVMIVGVVYVMNSGTSNKGSSTSRARSSRSADRERNPQLPDTEAVKKYKLNETVHVGYMSYEVREIWRQYSEEEISSRDRNSPNGGTGPAIFVRVAVRNNDDKSRQIPPFTLIDSNGAEYESASGAWLVDGAFGVLESLNPSVSKEGIVVFIAPEGRGYDLKLDGGFWSTDDALVILESKK